MTNTGNKEIYTLIKDIDDMIYNGVDIPEELLDEMCTDIKDALRKALKQGCRESGKHLRMSNIGTPPRKLWYMMKGYPGSTPSPAQARSFMYGHIIEAYMLMLAKAAGHTVEDKQKELVLADVIGHQDGKIDGIVMDVKGMSSYGYDKFESGRVLREDSFGYIPQISAYAQSQDKDLAGFLVFDKQRGKICTLLLDGADMVDAKKKILAARSAMHQDEPPAKCYAPIAAGTSGNEILSKNCEFCPFKFECWKDTNPNDNGQPQGIRTFQYSDGVKYFVKIEKEPRVPEIKKDANTVKESTEEVVEASLPSED